MKTLKSKVLPVLSIAVACALPLQPARAAIVSTEASAAQAAAVTQRERVRQWVSREDVARELVALGVDPASAQERVAALGEEELRAVAGRLDSLPAGARLRDNELILILVVIILVLILL